MMLKNLNKKHILSAALVGVASVFVAASANAAVAGPYVGGQLGYGNVHQDGFSNGQVAQIVDGTVVSSTNTSKDGGIAGRVFGGYQVNQNFAAELGFSKFSNATAKASAKSDTDSVTLKGTVKTYAIDLVGKGIIPLQYGFNIYGKAGLAYLNSSVDATGTMVSGDDRARVKGNDKAGHIYPTFGTGLGYDITQNINADVSWNRIQKTGHSDKLASTDLFAVGMAYNFG